MFVLLQFVEVTHFLVPVGVSESLQAGVSNTCVRDKCFKQFINKIKTVH